MAISSILSTVTLFVLFVAFLLAAFLLTVKTENKLSNRLLATFMIVVATTISVFFYGFYIELPFTIEKLRDDIGILASPLMFLYILSMLYKDFKLRPIHLLHLLPFIFIILLFTPGLYLADEAQKEIFFNEYYTRMDVKISRWITRFLAPFYYILTFVILYSTKKVLLENYSDDKLIAHKWLFQLTVFSTFIYLVALFKSFYRSMAINQDAVHVVRIFLTLMLLSLLTWIVMKALYYPKLFRGIDAGIKPLSNLLEDQKLSDDQNDQSEQQNNLLRFMETEKPYLDADLSLAKLASMVAIPANELSILINHSLGKHFFDFVNEYRIKAAQEELKNPNQSLTIQEIFYKVGFNSKSSFNTAFKKYSQITPTAFRLKHR